MANPIKSLIVLYSYHHHNTEKIANVISKILGAQIKSPMQTNPEELQEYDLIGFGSGIYGNKHHKLLFDLVEKLPHVKNKNAFIFSTCGAPIIFMGFDKGYFGEYITKSHLALKEKLESKGYMIVDEFSCAGHNTNNVNKLFGGINKGRPNAEDLKHAEEFAQKLKQNLEHNKN